MSTFRMKAIEHNIPVILFTGLHLQSGNFQILSLSIIFEVWLLMHESYYCYRAAL